MPWDFETEPEFQRELNWVDEFVREEVEPLDLVLGNPYDLSDRRVLKATKPLQEEVKTRGLWACHLGPDLGGPGYGQLKLALLNELLGRSSFAPRVFGCQAPDSGNAEILAHYGSPEQKKRFLQPLMDGEIVSCYSMTEPHAGADPTRFKTRAERDGDEWVINGEKWFSSNARYSSFLIVMVVTDPDVSPYNGMSMFLVPTNSPGVNIVRNVGVGTEPEGHGSHGYVRYENVRLSADHLLGKEGSAFVIAQTRLGGGRIHHAMRTVAQVKKAFDMMCERSLSRETQGEVLAQKQMVQERIADSWIEIEQFRLLVLRTAWRIDKFKDYRAVRKDIAAVKVPQSRWRPRRSYTTSCTVRCICTGPSVSRTSCRSRPCGRACQPWGLRRSRSASTARTRCTAATTSMATVRSPLRSSSRRARFSECEVPAGEQTSSAGTTRTETESSAPTRRTRLAWPDVHGVTTPPA